MSSVGLDSINSKEASLTSLLLSFIKSLSTFYSKYLKRSHDSFPRTWGKSGLEVNFSYQARLLFRKTGDELRGNYYERE